MNSIDAFQKRLRDETATVEKEIQSHNQQIEALNKRLEGLKRAAELFESEQAAIVELLQTGTTDGSGLLREMPTSLAAKVQNATTGAKAAAAHNQLGRNSQIGRGKTKTGPNTRTAGRNGGLTRVDMIAAVLKRHRGLSLRDLIAALDREFGWNSTKSYVTGLLYTNQKKFAHTKPDRAANRPVTWSLK